MRGIVLKKWRRPFLGNSGANLKA